MRHACRGAQATVSVHFVERSVTAPDGEEFPGAGRWRLQALTCTAVVEICAIVVHSVLWSWLDSSSKRSTAGTVQDGRHKRWAAPSQKCLA